MRCRGLRYPVSRDSVSFAVRFESRGLEAPCKCRILRLESAIRIATRGACLRDPCVCLARPARVLLAKEELRRRTQPRVREHLLGARKARAEGGQEGGGQG